MQRILTNDTVHKRPSGAIWLPCLWLLISSIRGTVFPSPEDPRYALGHPFPFLMVLLMVLGGVVLYLRRFELSAFVRENKFLVFLYCLMGVSILWSSFPWISFKRWVKTIGTLEMVLIVFVELNPTVAFTFVLRRLFYLVIPLSLGLILFVPSLGIRPYPDGSISWVGMFINRNALAMAAMIFSLYFVWNLTQREDRKNALLDSFLFLLSLITLVGTGSVTSLFGLLFGLATFVVIALSYRHVKNMGITLGYLFAVGLVLMLLLENLFMKSPVLVRVIDAMGRDTTLTGRIGLWSDLWKIALSHPFLGHGFGGFWVDGNTLLDHLWKTHRWLPMAAHNGYLGVFIDMGILGLAALFLVLYSTYRKISLSFVTDVETARLMMAFFLAIILHNLTETSLCDLDDPLWFYLLFTAVGSSRRLPFIGGLRRPVTDSN